VIREHFLEAFFQGEGAGGRLVPCGPTGVQKGPEMAYEQE